MDASVLLTGLVPSALLLLLGFLIRYRRMYFLISGYNTMPAEKQKNVDTEGLGRLMGSCLFAMGGLITAGMTLLSFRLTAAGLVFLISIVPVIVYLLIAAQKFDGNAHDASDKMKTGSKILISGVVILLIALTGGIAYSLAYNSKPVVVLLSDRTIEIRGMYGLSIERSDLKSITLQEDLPAILRRTNGMAAGSHLKGNFSMETIGSAMLFIDRSIPPFIIIRSTGKPVIINQATAADTKSLYDALLKK
jgi:hypothetical protein